MKNFNLWDFLEIIFSRSNSCDSWCPNSCRPMYVFIFYQSLPFFWISSWFIFRIKTSRNYLIYIGFISTWASCFWPSVDFSSKVSSKCFWFHNLCMTQIRLPIDSWYLSSCVWYFCWFSDTNSSSYCGLYRWKFSPVSLPHFMHLIIWIHKFTILRSHTYINTYVELRTMYHAELHFNAITVIINITFLTYCFITIDF